MVNYIQWPWVSSQISLQEIDKNMSSQICMMSSVVAMEILCITTIGSISSKKIAGVENCCTNVRL